MRYNNRFRDEVGSEGIAMSRRKPKAVYWQDAPMPREQLVLIPTHTWKT